LDPEYYHQKLILFQKHILNGFYFNYPLFKNNIQSLISFFSFSFYFYFLFFIFIFYLFFVKTPSPLKKHQTPAQKIVRSPIENNKSRVLVFAGKKSNSSPSAIVIVVPIVVSAVLIICIGLCYFYLRVRKEGKKVESKSKTDLSFVFANYDIIYTITQKKKKCLDNLWLVVDVPPPLNTKQ
jgi:hypothetical protein